MPGPRARLTEKLLFLICSKGKPWWEHPSILDMYRELSWRGNILVLRELLLGLPLMKHRITGDSTRS